MKKIAFMFAVAAMAVACGNEVALTAEDSAAVETALNDSIKAEIEAVQAPVACPCPLFECGKELGAKSE